ncbi:MAG: hypothetical protein E7033_05800 [Akkermansiaceae bacterium]|nr:hypothetical protein [Akkermansiaceae bacterium]
MEYVVSFTLLVALLAWVVSSYLRLFHLYEQVQGAWTAWSRAARRRNECLVEFVNTFAGRLPEGDVLPRDIRHWAEDSCRALDATPAPPRPGGTVCLNMAERHLRRAVSGSLHTVENTLSMQDDELLQSLCSAVSVSLYRQDELTALYNRSAGEYNSALSGPGAGLVASVFGFSPVEPVR